MLVQLNEGLKTMDEVNEAMGRIYYQASRLAMGNNQNVWEKGDYYVTLEQLEAIIKKIQEDNAE